MYTIYTTPCFDINKLSAKKLIKRYNIPNIRIRSGEWEGHSNKIAMMKRVKIITPKIGSGCIIKTVKIKIENKEYYFEVICGAINTLKNSCAIFEPTKSGYLYIDDYENKEFSMVNWGWWHVERGTIYGPYVGNFASLLNLLRDIVEFLTTMHWYIKLSILKPVLLNDIYQHMTRMIIHTCKNTYKLK